MEGYLTPEEVGDLLRVHVSTVRRWISQGLVLAVRLPGRGYRISTTEVARLQEPVGARK